MIDLMQEFQGRPDGEVALREDQERTPIWVQDAGHTVVEYDAPPEEQQWGKVAFAQSHPNSNGYSRLHTTFATGAPLRVVGWIRIKKWLTDDLNAGIKLYTMYEDNNASNTISILKKSGHCGWYVEDRVGLYGHHSPAPNIYVTTAYPQIKHRFVWEQQRVNGEMVGTMIINGVREFSVIDTKPLEFGMLGWRLDGCIAEWSIGLDLDF